MCVRAAVYPVANLVDSPQHTASESVQPVNWGFDAQYLPAECIEFREGAVDKHRFWCSAVSAVATQKPLSLTRGAAQASIVRVQPHSRRRQTARPHDVTRAGKPFQQSLISARLVTYCKQQAAYQFLSRIEASERRLHSHCGLLRLFSCVLVL